MSYSFNVRAATFADADLAITAKLDEVEAQQPIHARDRDLAYETAMNMLGECVAPEKNQEFSVSVAGSCYGKTGLPFDGISLSVNISIVGKTP